MTNILQYIIVDENENYFSLTQNVKFTQLQLINELLRVLT